ncbi:29743_t:CDS:2, partial [Gigaspora margarita]
DLTNFRSLNETDSDDAQNINDLLDKVSTTERCFAGVYVTNSCTDPFCTEVMKDNKVVKLYYTNDIDVVKIFKHCYEEEKTKDLMEFLKSKGATGLTTTSRRSDEEYENLGFEKDNSEGSNPEVARDFIGLMEEFSNSDFIKNKYGEDVFEFNLFIKPEN